MCKPPPNTENETLHVLDGQGIKREFIWRNGQWTTPGTSYGTKPIRMMVLGWRYEAPVEART